MSVETSQPSQPGDNDEPTGVRRFSFRSADSAAERDLDNPDVVSQDDDATDDYDGDTLVRGTVVDEEVDEEDADDDDADDPGVVAADADDDLQPTFTPVDGGPVLSSPDPIEPTLSETDQVPVVPAQATPAATGGPLADTTAIDLDGPLLGDAVGLRASWQQAQAGFVDDPRAAVADAAELVEHTAQTLIGSLQQRQRQLRTRWDNNGSGAAGPAADELSDTEQLRHLMQDYRSLFNQLCQP
jgi:hypothetical protein